MVHRDVKPGNVIVPARRRPRPGAPAKLTDFGIARIAGEQSLTNTGDVIGTIEYMSPEQALGRPAGPQADLYSLALTIYEGFAGDNPLRGATVAATARADRRAARAACRRAPEPPETGSAERWIARSPRTPAQRGTLAELREALESATLVQAPSRRAPARSGDHGSRRRSR